MIWWKNDCTYQGSANSSGLCFNSPLKESENCISMSEQLCGELKDYILSLNHAYGRSIVHEDWLNSYDNPDYLWITYELENLRKMYNMSQRNPQTGEILPGRGQIPYVQIRLTQNAVSDFDVYPKSTINAYGSEITPHYVVEFECTFLKAFTNFLFAVFDDNPQQYISNGEQKYVLYQHKAPIYRQPSFEKYFPSRHDLPGIMIHKAVQMLLAHELAHVGCGHLDLQANDPDFGMLRDTILVEEDDADTQAICWVLGIRYLEASNTQLEITLADLQQELALSVFSIYMLFTWNYSKEDRVWSDAVMDKYNKLKMDHLPYQLRAYNLLNVCCGRMDKLGIWSERDNIVSLDGKAITRRFMQDAFDEAVQMIHAFEHAYHMFYAHSENVYELALDEKYDELNRMIMQEQIAPSKLDKRCIPWLFGFEDSAQAELKRLHSCWPAVRERLLNNGTYCVPKPVAPWNPLK